MKKVITSERIPIKLWLDNIEDGALSQARNLANLPFAFKHVAVMPDAHQGFGMPIGGVIATEGVVIPNAVGVDIGCGMCAVKTSLREIGTETIKKIMGRIRKAVPVGFNKHKSMQEDILPSPATGVQVSDMSIVPREYGNARKSVGTLGGGNHFIEIQKGSGGYIWIMIHSGSRNLGLKVADHYNRIAVKLNEKWRTEVPKKWELAFLPLDSPEGQKYLAEMRFCVDYAFINRKLMMDRIVEIFIGETKASQQFDPMINIAHNYAALENHFGKNVMVHRKGATLAREGMVGIIPGSQGASSYIVQGKGSKESFMSCAHGAGRKMGRKQATRVLDLAAETKKLNDMGVIHAVRGRGQLDEAPGAYKDIDTVMKNQEDLVGVIVKLKPLAVVKG